MRGFLDRLSVGLQEFMQGRYGNDQLNVFLLIVGLILVLLQMFIPFASMIVWVVFAVVIWRTLSKNIPARQAANEKFLNITKAPRKFFTTQKKHWDNRKTTVYFKCANCKQSLSVPRGKGKIRIICPKCGKEIYKTT